jgi:hypothetical protein
MERVDSASDDRTAKQADTDNSSQTVGIAGCGPYRPYTDPPYVRMRALEMAIELCRSGNVPDGTDPVDVAEQFVKFING